MRFAAVVTILLQACFCIADTPDTVDRWAKEMQRFDETDKSNPPREDGVVFTGSSSVRLWNLAESFPSQNAVNRGFGGSQYSDIVRHLDRLVLRHKPRVVVLYSGDNDIKSGKPASDVARDVETIVSRVRSALPATKIVIVSIKPSRARWNLSKEIQKANAGIAAVCEANDGCEFVDVWPAMLGDDGQPRQQLFVKDGLHLSAEGYAIWTELVGAHLR